MENKIFLKIFSPITHTVKILRFNYIFWKRNGTEPSPIKNGLGKFKFPNNIIGTSTFNDIVCAGILDGVCEFKYSAGKYANFSLSTNMSMVK